MFNKVDSNAASTPMSNFYELNSSTNPLVDIMASSNFNESNDESSNFKLQQLLAKRRSITSSPIRKNTTNAKTSHQIQPFEINSNENEFRKANLYEGYNSSQLSKSNPNKIKRYS